MRKFRYILIIFAFMALLGIPGGDICMDKWLAHL